MATTLPSPILQLEQRWKSDWDKNTRLGPARAHFNRVLEAGSALHAEKAKIAANRDLSDTGRAAALKKFAETKVVPPLAKAIRAVDQNARYLERRRQALLPSVKDPTNVAGAILRAQMRDRLAEMGHSKAAALLMREDADSRLLEAVIEAPLLLSGVTQADHEALMQLYVEREHAPAAAGIAEEAEALATLRAATQVAVNSLKTDIGFPHQTAFNDWMENTAEAAGALKNDDPEISALSVNAIAADAERLPAAARRTLIDQLMNQQSAALTRPAA